MSIQEGLVSAESPEERCPGDSIPKALRSIARGTPIVLESNEHGEDLMMAAEFAEFSWTAFFVKHTSGLLSVALPEWRCDELNLPPMVSPYQRGTTSPSAVSVDAAEGISTGISASDRARTVQLLAGETTLPGDFHRPGHVLPLRTDSNGVLGSRRPAEACVDLCRLADVRPAGVRSELLRTDGALPSRSDARAFAAEHGLVSVSIDELIAYRRRFLTVEPFDNYELRTNAGTFVAVGYRSGLDQAEHLALIAGKPDKCRAPVVGIHLECTRGDVFGALNCNCGASLRQTMSTVAHAGSGVVLYLRGDPPPPGACDGADPVDYPAAAAILRQLGISRARMVGEASKVAHIWSALGITIAGTPSPAGTPTLSADG